MRLQIRTLFTRFVINDKGVGATTYESTHTAEDWWEEGTFVGAQHRNRAIVAYGLQARLRPAHSYKLSVNMLGVAQAEVRVGGDAVDLTGTEAVVVGAGQAVCIGAGMVYVAIIPLEPSDMGSDAPIELRVDGERLTVDIYNYRGPAKTFWEHRSQSGPFYKGNVRNAAVIEVAERSEYADIDVFAMHIASAMLADAVDDDNVREIAYASAGAAASRRATACGTWRRQAGASTDSPMPRQMGRLARSTARGCSLCSRGTPCCSLARRGCWRVAGRSGWSLMIGIAAVRVRESERRRGSIAVRDAGDVSRVRVVRVRAG